MNNICLVKVVHLLFNSSEVFWKGYRGHYLQVNIIIYRPLNFIKYKLNFQIILAKYCFNSIRELNEQSEKRNKSAEHYSIYYDSEQDEERQWER